MTTTTLRSMTGFGSAEGPLSDRLLAHIRLTSLNARYLELTIRTQPRLEIGELEPVLRGVLSTAIARGRVQVNLELQPTGARAVALSFRPEAAAALLGALATLPAELRLAPVALRDLLSLPGFVEGGGDLALDDEERGRLLALVAAARDRLVLDREKEAAALLPQIEAEVGTLADFRAWLDSVNGQIQAALLVRLRERLAKLLDGAAVDEQRLLQEAALLADRADVSEEVQRLAAHLDHLRRLLAEGGPVGKKIDFLLQELLREVNTSASKCRDAGMGERVVAAKAALEKLREQCANLE